MKYLVLLTLIGCAKPSIQKEAVCTHYVVEEVMLEDGTRITQYQGKEGPCEE